MIVQILIYLKIIWHTGCCDEVTVSIQHQWETFSTPSLRQRIKPKKLSYIWHVSSLEKFAIILLSPLWQGGVVKAEFLVSLGEPLHVLSVFALLEHFICFLHVEWTAHAPIGWKQCENAWTVESHSLPGTPLDHSLNWCIVQWESCFSD